MAIKSVESILPDLYTLCRQLSVSSIKQIYLTAQINLIQQFTMEKESYNNDAELQKLLDRANIQKPVFECAKGHPISIICISAQCKHPAFLCSICDLKIHQKCNKQTLDTLHLSLLENVDHHKAIVKKNYEIGMKIIQLIKQNQQTLVEKAMLLGYQKDKQHMIDGIFIKKQIKNYKGEEMKQLKQALLQKIERNEKKQPRILKNIESTFLKMKKIIQQDFEKLFMIDSSFTIYDLKSQIVKKQKDLVFIEQSLRSAFQFKSLQLLYRASENDFSALEFHKKCDNIKHTLTIIRTEFDKIIAAYTPIKWSQQHGIYKQDHSQKSFLLQIDLKQKMRLISPQCAIYCDSKNGPTLGNGHDIFIADHCNVNENSYSYFPYGYNFMQQPYIQSQQTSAAFSGATDGYSFRVLEYEVYKLQSQQVKHK